MASLVTDVALKTRTRFCVEVSVLLYTWYLVMTPFGFEGGFHCTDTLSLPIIFTCGAATSLGDNSPVYTSLRDEVQAISPHTVSLILYSVYTFKFVM